MSIVSFWCAGPLPRDIGRETESEIVRWARSQHRPPHAWPFIRAMLNTQHIAHVSAVRCPERQGEGVEHIARIVMADGSTYYTEHLHEMVCSALTNAEKL
jgi:hypothetical protein